MIFDSDLLLFAKAFQRLKRGSTKFGLAPHKPILLLSVIDLFEKELIIENAIKVNEQLVACFLDNWRNLVTQPFQPDFTQPFYYLQSEKINGSSFWLIKSNTNQFINAHIKSFDKLRQVVDYAYLPDSLYKLLLNSNSRNYLKQVLLETYFNDYKETNTENSVVEDFSLIILNEPAAIYKRIIVDTEEEVYLRGSLFKRLIPQIYGQECAFTGWRVQTTSGLSLVDACHIKPFSLCKEDNVRNGISLSPNIHRAFDRGMLSVDNDFRILVSNQIIEDNNHIYNLNNLKGRRISLPKSENHYPSIEFLEWHRKYCFRN